MDLLITGLDRQSHWVRSDQIVATPFILIRICFWLPANTEREKSHNKNTHWVLSELIFNFAKKMVVQKVLLDFTFLPSYFRPRLANCQAQPWARTFVPSSCLGQAQKFKKPSWARTLPRAQLVPSSSPEILRNPFLKVRAQVKPSSCPGRDLGLRNPPQATQCMAIAVLPD